MQLVVVGLLIRECQFSTELYLNDVTCILKRVSFLCIIGVAAPKFSTKAVCLCIVKGSMFVHCNLKLITLLIRYGDVIHTVFRYFSCILRITLMPIFIVLSHM